jgi:hypothetical protein
MAFATILLIIGTFLAAIAALLVVLNEPELGSWEPLEWAIISLPFFIAGHWVPGRTGPG